MTDYQVRARHRFAVDCNMNLFSTLRAGQFSSTLNEGAMRISVNTRLVFDIDVFQEFFVRYTRKQSVADF